MPAFLNLNLNELGSTLSPRIQQLSNLQTLHLSQNRMTGTLPVDALQNLKDLTFFAMEDMDVSGPIYEVALSWPNLEYLVWTNMSPSDTPEPIPAGIGGLTQLIDLILGDVHPPLPTELGLLENLEYLELFLASPLANNNISVPTTTVSSTIPTELGNLTNLVRMVLLDGLRLTGTLPTEFGQLTNLEYLDVGSTALTGGLPTEFEAMTKLELLNLQDNVLLTGTFPHELGVLAQSLGK